MQSSRSKWSIGARLVASIAMLLALVMTLALLPGDSATASERNLIVNGGFEEPALANDGDWLCFSLNYVPGWSLTPSSEGDCLEIQRRDVGSPHTGNQLAELDGFAATDIFQTIATESGSVYELSFAFSARPGRPLEDNRIQVRWNGTILTATAIPTPQHTWANPHVPEYSGFVDWLELDGTGKDDTDWIVFTYRVVATSDTSRVDFVYMGPSNTFGGYIDTVKLVPQGCKSVKSGLWQDPGTWSCGAVPGGDNDVTIQTGHVVTISVPVSAARGITIETGGQLKKAANQTLHVKGDWKQDGDFDPNTGKVIFDGKQKQNISGSKSEKTFNDVDVDKPSGTLESDDSLDIKAMLRLIRGQMDAGNTKLNHLDIFAHAKLKSKQGKTKEVKGDWTQKGQYEHGQSCVVFKGDKKQHVKGDPTQPSKKTTFYCLEVEKQKQAVNPGDDDDELEADNSLEVLDKLRVARGKTQLADAKLKHVEVQKLTEAIKGTLKTKQGSTQEVSGDWKQDGDFTPDPTSKVKMTGSEKQQILGNAFKSFAILEIQKTQNQQQVEALKQGSLAVTTKLSILKGTFVSASDYNDVFIATDGTLNVPSNESITVTGNWEQDGNFQPGENSIVAFTGGTLQTIKGNAPQINFENLVVNKTQLTSELDIQKQIEVMKTLHLQKGQLSTDNAKLKDLETEPQTKLKTKPGRVKDVSGDWKQKGDYLPEEQSKVKFTGDREQRVEGGKDFTMVEVDKQGNLDPSKALKPDDAFTVMQKLLVKRGQVDLKKSKLKDVEIQKQSEADKGKLTTAPNSQQEVSGDWTQDGDFEAGVDSTVIFNGPAAQKVKGTAAEKAFEKLKVLKDSSNESNRTLDTDDSLKVKKELDVEKGKLLSGNSKLRDVKIKQQGEIESKPSKTKDVSGDWEQDGNYKPNTGKVMFTGDTDKSIKGQAMKSFYELIIAKQNTQNKVTALPSPIFQVNKLLHVQKGTFISSTTYIDVVIEDDGVLIVPEGGELDVEGNFTNDGEFVAEENSTVTFNGSVEQVISGSKTTTFSNLKVQNELKIESNVKVEQSLTLEKSVAITSSGSLTIESGAEVTAGPGVTLEDGVAPVVSAISIPTTLVQVNTLVHASVPFSDPGLLDEFSATWEWGDGAITDGTVDYDQALQAGVASGSHAYSKPGIYTVRVTVADDDGEDSAQFAYVIVFDPRGGHVTGGGWFTTPDGSWAAQPSFAGRTQVNINLKYHPNNGSLNGNAAFSLHQQRWNFSATGYDWLVVDGSRAWFQGSGRLDNQDGYGFLVAMEEQGKTQLIRIKVWNLSTGEVLYDTQPGAPDDAAPTTVHTNGSLKVHAR
jgi:hypothetical protein